MENKYYIIDYEYDYPNFLFFIRELIPNKDFNCFVKFLDDIENEYLANEGRDGCIPDYGAMYEYVNINKEQRSPIRDLNIIKGYYTNKEEAEKDLDKLINSVEKAKKKYIF